MVDNKYFVICFYIAIINLINMKQTSNQTAHLAKKKQILNLRIYKLMLFVAFLSCYCSKARAQCTSCDLYLDKIYDKVSIKKEGDFKANFETWFFSDDFEKEVKDNKVGLSITLPIEGVPVTFGGNYESPDAWQTRKINKGSTKWDFSKVTKSTVFTEIATTESRLEWYNCIAACPQTPLPVSVSSGDDDAAILTFKYNSDYFDSPPKILGFAVTGGLSATTANHDYKNQLMTRGGIAIVFSWKDETSTSGTIIMNTTRGSTVPITITRAPKANEAVITFTMARLGDYNKLEELDFVQHISSRLAVLGMSSVKDGGCPIRSPDGKFCANQAHIIIPAQYGDVFKNFSYTAVALPPYNAAFCQVVGKDDNPTEVGITVNNWGPTALYEISCDVYHPKIITTAFMIKALVVNNQFSFDVFKTFGYGNVDVNLLNQHKITFSLMATELPKQVTLINKLDGGDHWTYTYKLNK